jgi:ribosomal-protein-alanine N-acetyltransferase
VIRTERLLLWPMSAAFLQHSLAGDHIAAAGELGYAIDAEWLVERELMAMRLHELQQDPDARPWLLRAIIDQATQQMVGHVGFHTRPNPPYLADVCLDAVEFGYTVYTAHRRRGIAWEAAQGLMQWAHRESGVGNFIASASPSNGPSIALLGKLGFERIGGHEDEIDGYEDVYRLRVQK